MDDLYADLPEDTSNTHITKLEDEIECLQIRIRDLEKVVEADKSKIANIEKSLEVVREENLILRANMSSLYRTAKAEIVRKNQQIEEYRKSLSQYIWCGKQDGDKLVDLRRSDKNLCKISDRLDYSPPMRRDVETIDENYQDELSKERSTLKILIDEILRKLHAVTKTHGQLNEDSCSPLVKRNGLSKYYSDIPSYVSSNDDSSLPDGSQKSKKLKKKLCSSTKRIRFRSKKSNDS